MDSKGQIRGLLKGRIILLMNVHDLVPMRRYDAIKLLLELGVLVFLFSELLLQEVNTVKPVADSSQHLRFLLGALDYILLRR